MASKRTPEAGKMSVYSTGRESPSWLGIVLLILIESTVYAAMIASYYYLFSNATVWPPNDIDEPDVLLPTIYTALLLVSIVPAWLGGRAIANDSRAGLMLWLAVGALLLIAALAVRVYQYFEVDVRWDNHAYGSIVWLIAVTHALHVLAVVVMVLAALALAGRGFFGATRRAAVQAITLYSVYGAIAWIPLYATVSLFPNLA